MFLVFKLKIFLMCDYKTKLQLKNDNSRKKIRRNRCMWKKMRKIWIIDEKLL